MDAPREYSSDDITRLGTGLNDLGSILALPGVWAGAEPSQIVSTLVDTLLEILHLSVVEDPCAFREEAFALPFSPDSPTTTTGPDAVISDLSGSWENERSVLRVNDAGDYVVLGPDADPDRPLTGGFVAREEGNFIFVSGVAGECPGQTGVYSAEFEDDLLTLTVVDDPCAARVAWFEPVYTSATG